MKIALYANYNNATFSEPFIVFCHKIVEVKFLLVNRKSLYEVEMVVGHGNDKKNDLFEQIQGYS